MVYYKSEIQDLNIDIYIAKCCFGVQIMQDISQGYLIQKNERRITFFGKF
jgi:hypothetical protein